MTWLFLESPPCPAPLNMALDEALLELAPEVRHPVLRFYGWSEPAASFGYFQRMAEVERLTLLRPLVRRPTGGGLVPHDADWTYSLTFPRGHLWYELAAEESYRRAHEWLRWAFAQVGVETEIAPCCRPSAGQCFAGYEKSDLLWHGKKVAGAAQRRTKLGLLIQGSIQPPRLRLRRPAWQAAMRSTATQQWAVDWLGLPGFDAGTGPSPPAIAPQLAETAAKLRDVATRLAQAKYSQDAYNRKR